MTQSQNGRPSPTVAIIGAGFGGICMGIKLKRYGIPFTILEKADHVGGVWRDNVYPGAACDIPSHLYCYSFEPSHDGSRTYGQAAEIQSYIENCARKHGVLEHVRFGSEVTGAAFDAESGRWTVELADGPDLEARFLVAATGQLSLPAEPSFPGLDGFPGNVFHSARWDHEYEMTGKRVAVIGSGASAIQFVPQIAPKVAKLHLFQRSAPYVLPKPDRPYTPLEKYLYRHFPVALVSSRTRKYLYHEARVVPMTKGHGMSLIKLAFERNLRRQVEDPALRAGCTSWYRTAGGKNTNNWPSYTIEYRRRTRFFDAGNYDIHPSEVHEPVGSRHQ